MDKAMRGSSIRRLRQRCAPILRTKNLAIHNAVTLVTISIHDEFKRYYLLSQAKRMTDASRGKTINDEYAMTFIDSLNILLSTLEQSKEVLNGVEDRGVDTAAVGRQD